MIRRSPESELRSDLRDVVDRICADFPGQYWRDLDRERAYPEKFVDALTGTGCLGALIPEEYGGLGLSVPARPAGPRRADRPADPDDGQPRDQRAVLRQPAGPGDGAHRRGRGRVPLRA